MNDPLPPPAAGETSPPPAVAAPRPSISASSALIVGGVALVALAAAAGGAIWWPRPDEADHGSAVARGLVGGGVGLAVAGAAVMIARRRTWWRRLGFGSALVAAVLAVTAALGSMLGAATAGRAAPSPRAPQQTATDALDTSDDRDDTGGGRTIRLSEAARVSLVDRDGDGVADVDAFGRLIVGLDADGDGFFETRLVPCRSAERVDDGEVTDLGGVRIDVGCDGTLDRIVPLSSTMLRHEPGTRIGESQLIADATDDINIDDDDEPDRPVDQRDQDDDDDRDLGPIVRTVLLVLGAIAAAAIAWAVVRFTRRDRTERLPSPAVTTDEDHETIDEQAAEAAIEESIDTLLGHPDPRLGIRAAYAVLLDALSDAGFARRSFEAPEEHLERCLQGLQIEAGPMRELLRLFAVARYSTHEVTEAHRAEALDALRRSQDLLRERNAAATAGVATAATRSAP